MNKSLLIFTLGALTCCTAQVLSQEDDSAYREGYDLILEQRWSDAGEHFRRFQEQWPDSAWADDAGFWHCYSREQQEGDQEPPFQCYEQFIADWPDSSWVADARSRLSVLGSGLASRGRPQFRDRLRNLSVLRSMGREDDFDIDVNVNIDGGNIRGNRFNRRSRSSADDELLTILAALRDDERASEILMQRLDASDDAMLRGRIVLLLEEIEGEAVTRKLVGITAQDESMQVRENAVIVLLDRDDALSRDRLIEILGDDSFAVSIRAEIISEMDHWEDDSSLAILERILDTTAEPLLIKEASEALADNGGDEAMRILLDAFNRQQNIELRYLMLKEIAEMETPAVTNMLSDIALTGTDDELAAIAIEGIAEREDNVGLAALDHIYFNTNNRQRRLAALEGIGESENEQAVEVLSRIIAVETAPQLLAAAANALGETERESAIPVLLTLYRGNDSTEVQRGAIRGLRELDRYPAATEAMLEILEQRLDAEGGQ